MMRQASPVWRAESWARADSGSTTAKSPAAAKITTRCFIEFGTRRGGRKLPEGPKTDHRIGCE